MDKPQELRYHVHGGIQCVLRQLLECSERAEMISRSLITSAKPDPHCKPGTDVKQPAMGSLSARNWLELLPTGI
jgi:hypothetical protein